VTARAARRAAPPSTGPRYAVFETEAGACGVCWTPRGLRRVVLPGAGVEATRAALAAAVPGAAEAETEGEIAAVVDRLRAHLAGAPQEFGGVALDLDGATPFAHRVYDALRTVRAGEVTTYAALAARAGSPAAARAVGRAMATNPLPIVVPCHRVLAAAGRLGGYSAPGGVRVKVDLLAAEGVTLPGAALGLRFEPAEAMTAIAAAEPAMARVIERAGPLRLLVDPLESPFVALAKAIVYQQLTGKAAATIFARLEAAFGGALPPPAVLRDAPDEVLRGVGLSRAKAAGLKDLAAKTDDGVVPTLRVLQAMSDEAVVRRLTTVRGIGRWTVEMLLIFRLGRADVFPVDDYGVRKGLAALAGGGDVPTPRTAAELGERFRPFRTAASWYCWRAGELGAEALWREG
jgi:methylated-DNA-[protein]-cysteine S-methyltransferase